ncbi:HAD family hydrolase [Variovorax sp. KBW07]|uniref:HAD family hydrolase n=1 Tax=Variovorax sp. KBW07 TaxID=2153358 RepID=UPI000F5636DD|nr:HAD-IB family phosphatase [Variovorax sp. KBW07]RQO49205.1 HAD family hydrolase [Variovorax sp. KBW07]
MTTHFAFDLDGTITTQELLPLIASELDLLSEMRLLTRLTLDGTIGFEESFRLRCAILQSIPISDVQEIVAETPLNSDIAEFIEANSDRCSVVTGNLDVWVRPILERLGCRHFCSTAVTEGNRLVQLDRVLHKSKPIHELKLGSDRVVAIGEGANDLPMFEAADVGVAYGGVHSPVQSLIEISDYVVFEGSALCRLLNTL